MTIEKLPELQVWGIKCSERPAKDLHNYLNGMSLGILIKGSEDAIDNVLELRQQKKYYISQFSKTYVDNYNTEVDEGEITGPYLELSHFEEWLNADYKKIEQKAVKMGPPPPPFS